MPGPCPTASSPRRTPPRPRRSPQVPGGSGSAPGRGGRHSWALESRRDGRQRAGRAGRARRPRLPGLGRRRCQVSAGRLRALLSRTHGALPSHHCRRHEPPDPGCIPPASCAVPRAGAVSQPLPACLENEDPGLLGRGSAPLSRGAGAAAGLGRESCACVKCRGERGSALLPRFAPFCFNSAMQRLRIPCFRVRPRLRSEP